MLRSVARLVAIVAIAPFCLDDRKPAARAFGPNLLYLLRPRQGRVKDNLFLGRMEVQQEDTARDGDFDVMEVKVWRGGDQGAYQLFDVPRRANQTVLDVVTWIQRYADPTLSYRFACRVGVCGSCAMTVNGRPRWTCRTHVSKVVEGDRLEIAPLSNLPVIKDLATDMSEFFQKWQKAQGSFKPTRTRHDPVAAISPSDETRIKADESH